MYDMNAKYGTCEYRTMIYTIQSIRTQETRFEHFQKPLINNKQVLTQKGISMAKTIETSRKQLL